MTAHAELLAAGATTRAAADLCGVSRATAARAKARAASNATPVVAAVVTPANRLSAAEGAHVLAVLNSEEFVDAPPVQVYARLLSAGTYLCSVSTMYRILAANAQVKERRRLARHPARVAPELVATGAGQVYTWGHHQAARPGQGLLLRRVRDDRHLLALHRRGPRAREGVRAAG